MSHINAGEWDPLKEDPYGTRGTADGERTPPRLPSASPVRVARRAQLPRDGEGHRDSPDHASKKEVGRHPYFQ